MLSCIVLLTGCAIKEESNVYENAEYGFRIIVPESWAGEYEIEEIDYSDGSGKNLIISSKVNSIAYLGFIEKYAAKEWETKLQVEGEPPVEFLILGSNSEIVFVFYFASDVSYDPNDNNSVSKFESMRQDLLDGNFQFEII
jgi:hypothetical protein